MSPPVFIILVTHNSARELEFCLAHLARQTLAPEKVVIVDSGSDSTRYLENLNYPGKLLVCRKDNIGFGRANNFGLAQLPVTGGAIGVFINPDTFLTRDFIARMCRIFAEKPDISVLTGKLLGFDLQEGAPTGKIDSTGISRRWYGRWYDRGQGEEDRGQYGSCEYLQAACGALLCCRGEMLAQLGLQFFDEDFFMYKEDIELGFRLRKLGYKVLYDPSLIAYHCRGWQRARQKMTLAVRLLAARNEVLLYRKHPSPYMLWAVCKYLLVRFTGI